MTEHIKDGDIFRWRYKDEKPSDLGSYRRYHCKSQIAIAQDGLLIDTFWGWSSDSAHWQYADAIKQLDLTLLGNLADLEKRPESQARYYDDADIVNINHSNSSRDNFYIRKGAQRSRAKMMATIADRIAELDRGIEWKQRRLTEARWLRGLLENGAPLEEIHL